MNEALGEIPNTKTTIKAGMLKKFYFEAKLKWVLKDQSFITKY